MRLSGWSGLRRELCCGQMCTHAPLTAAVRLRALVVRAVPGVLANEERRAVDFGAFFSCEDGTTPQELLRAGIYNQIAIALKGGPWRRASLVVIASAFAQSARAPQRPVIKRPSTSAKNLLSRSHVTLSNASSSNAAGAATAARSRLGRVVALVVGRSSRSEAPVVSATKASVSVEVESSSHSGVA